MSIAFASRALSMNWETEKQRNNYKKTSNIIQRYVTEFNKKNYVRCILKLFFGNT